MLQSIQATIHSQLKNCGSCILRMPPSGGTTELTRYHQDYHSVDDRKSMYHLDQEACTRLWALSETGRIEFFLYVFRSGACLDRCSCLETYIP